MTTSTGPMGADAGLAATQAGNLFFDDSGVGSNLSAAATQDPAMRQNIMQYAQELAKQLEPPQPGSLQQLAKNPQLLQQMMGAVRGYGDEKQKAQQAAMGRHFVNPPVSGGGGNPQAMMPGLFNQAAQRRQGSPVPPLGALIGGRSG